MPTPPKNATLSKKALGERLRSLRREKGITQVEVAAALETTQSNVSAIERGARGLTIPQVMRLARILGASADEILFGLKAGLEKEEPAPSRRLLRRMQRIESLNRRDQEALLRTIDAFLSKAS